MAAVQNVEQNGKTGSSNNPIVRSALDFTKSTGIKLALKDKPIDRNVKVVYLPKDSVDKVKPSLSNLQAALSSKTSKYDLDKVIKILKDKNISLDKLMNDVQLMSVIGIPGGDELLKYALEAAGLSEAEIAALQVPSTEAKPDSETPGTLELPDLPEEAETPKPAEDKAAKAPAPPTIKESTSAKPATAARPQGLDENGYQAWLAVVQISGRSDDKELSIFKKAWGNDGKIDLDEARELGINGREDQLFRAGDNRMRVNQTGYNGKGDNDHYLDLGELQEIVKVALEYSNLPGQGAVDPAKAFDLFRTSYLVDIDYDGVKDKLNTLCASGAGGFNGLDLTKLNDKEYLEKQFSSLKAQTSTELFNLLIAKIQGKEIKSANGIGIYTFKYAMASMTGQYDAFGVPELKETVDKGKIGQYQPRRPESSADDFISWVKEGKVKGEDDKLAGDKSSAEAAQKTELARRDISDAKDSKEAVKKYEEAVKDGRLTKDDKSALDAIANKYLRGKEYATLVEFAKKLDAGVKDQFYGQVFENVQKDIVAKLGNTTQLAEAVKYLEEIDSLVKGMDEAGDKFKGEVARMRLQVALRFADAAKPDKDKAYEVINKLPADAEISWKAGEETKSLTRPEARFMVAEKFKDAKPMNELLKEEKTAPADQAIAHIYLAKIKGSPSDKNGLENILKEYELAAKAVKSEETPKARALRERMRGEMEEAITKYHRSHQTNAVTSAMQKLRDKYINKMPDPDVSPAAAKKGGKKKTTGKDEKTASGKKTDPITGLPV